MSRLSARRRDRIERRERIALLVEEMEKEGKDPFSLDLRAILDDLREDYDSDDVELLLADSRAVESLSRLVEMQDEWIDGRLLASMSPEALRRRAEAADARELAEALYLAQSPAVGISNIDEKFVVEAARYWEGLRPSRPQEAPIPREYQGTAVLEPDSFEEDLANFRGRLLDALEGGGGEVEVAAVLSDDREAAVRELYLLAHLVTHGEVGLRYDPEGDRYLVTKHVPDEVRSLVMEI
ncbi:MAG: hypothetical protein ACP5GG_04995 [Conexivisphaera sp.]